MFRSLTRMIAGACAVFAVCGTLVFAAGPTCTRVEGFLEESLVTGPACTSPVGLCTVARMFGSLKGEANFVASAIIPFADTPTTTVVFVTGDSLVVDAQLQSRRGTLTVKNAAAYRTSGNGDLVDNQTIIGGTGDFTGAVGSLRVTGTFLSATGGTSRFEGRICVP